ncbi:MAG: DUF1737 domain-containing protein [Pseudomonadota bacterium]
MKHWDHTTVEREVNELINAGWQPFGPPSTTVSDTTLIIIQAMVKYA